MSTVPSPPISDEKNDTLYWFAAGQNYSAGDYFDNPIIIMDDYGNPNNRNIRMSIDEKIKEGKIKIHKKIGEDVGYKTKAGWEMIDREGVILC